MTATEHSASDWLDANRRHLVAALEEVRGLLELQAAKTEGKPAPEIERKAAPEDRVGELSPPPALETLCAAFGLVPFERAVLLLCAGVELDASFAPLCARAQENPNRSYPTFGLALAAFPQADWATLSPVAPLRRARLVDLEAGAGLTAARLRIDERILHYLLGVEYRDERLPGLAEPILPPGELVPSHQEIADRLAAAWQRTTGTPEFPVIQLCGGETAGKRAIAATACAGLGLGLHAMSAGALPAEPAELENLIRLWEREALLSPTALLLDCEGVDGGDAAREELIERLVDRCFGPLILVSLRRRRPRNRPVLTFDVEKPTTAEQRAVWGEALGEAATALDGRVDSLVFQFNLGAPAIHAAHAGALGRLGAESATPAEAPPEEMGRALWDSCRLQARPRLEDLARRIDAAAGWSDLVIPAAQRQTLEQIAVHLRQRGRVHESWGFAARSARGLGVSALFAGTSGTGKTMAAEVLARELGLDLYLIDLSAVVSKYIGETEKNLRRVFDAAEEGGAILLFDEADALFGRRSEVRDSHDRYANIEISYLLQRMESYRGLAILTTNLKDALDPAFLRRLRFVVEFPFPDAAGRAEIWRRIFPSETPVEGLDVRKLARLDVSGGTIRNIALAASYLAADAEEPVRMEHLLRAARAEFAKIQKPLSETDLRDWT